MKIALLGDIALFGKLSVRNNPRASECFSEIGNYLNNFDFVVGNLETPFSVAKKKGGAKSAYICSDPANVSVLKQLHISAVTLANNHMFDFGEEGYELTKKILRDANIDWFGTEGKELFIEQGGNKIVFSGFCCYSTNPLRCVKMGEYGVNAYDIKDVIERLQYHNNEGYLNILAVHAGLEHVNYPSIEHIRAARKLAKICPYVYYGHHPHVIQGIEEYNQSLIAHSLGNLCFDNIYTDKSNNKPLVKLTDNNRRGLILELNIEENTIKEWRAIMLYIQEDGFIRLLKQDDSLKQYNQVLKNCEENVEQYNARRQHIIVDRISERKAMRDFKWYFKRLRPRYVKLALDMHINSKKYFQAVKQYL